MGGGGRRMRVTGRVDRSKSGRDKIVGSDDGTRCLTSRRHGGNIALISENKKKKRPSDLWLKNRQNNWRP